MGRRRGGRVSERAQVVSWLYGKAEFYNGGECQFIPHYEQSIIGAAVGALAHQIEVGVHLVLSGVPEGRQPLGPREESQLLRLL